MGQYSPLAYLPQSIAAFVGRSLNLNAGIIYYLMCLSSLLFSAVCVFWAMKILPEKKQIDCIVNSRTVCIVRKKNELYVKISID